MGRRARRKALGRTHWATLHLTEYAVFSGYLICVHEITSASRAFQYQGKSLGSSKLLQTTQSQRSTQLLLREMTASGNSLTEGPSRPSAAAALCDTLRCQRTPAQEGQQTMTGRYGSKEKEGGLERA